MEKHSSRFAIICSVGLLLCLIAFSACVAAEFKRTKVKDLKLLDGNLCYLPGSPASGLGITAAICLSVVQIVGTYVIGKRFCSGEKTTDEQPDKQTIAICLLVLSWITYGIAIILLGATSSMNKRQEYGEGWLDGECYVVKDGVYIAIAMLMLATIFLLVGSMFLTGMNNLRKQVEQGRKVHAQVVA